jgi:hypothetical protein
MSYGTLMESAYAGGKLLLEMCMRIRMLRIVLRTLLSVRVVVVTSSMLVATVVDEVQELARTLSWRLSWRLMSSRERA